MCGASLPTKWHMQRAALIQAFHSDNPSTKKLSSYINDVRRYMGISYACLSVVSNSLWLQCSITSTLSQAALDLPSAPEPLDEYSIARQLQEMALDDPLASFTEYTMDDDLPSDIQELSESQVCSLLALAACSSCLLLLLALAVQQQLTRSLTCTCPNTSMQLQS